VYTIVYKPCTQTDVYRTVPKAVYGPYTGRVHGRTRITAVYTFVYGPCMPADALFSHLIYLLLRYLAR